MKFPANIYLAAWAGAFFLSLLSLPVWRRICLRVGLMDDPGHRKIHSEPIPLAGGFAVLTGMLIPLLVATSAILLQPSLNAEFLHHGLYPSHRAIQLAAIVFGAVAMAALGGIDDKYELKPLAKFSGQFLIALIVAAAKVRITLFVPNVIFSYSITILWILTVINAFNFMDNMNGLSGGLGAIGASCFGIIAVMESQYLVALLALLTSGALIGFLPHNFPRARAFLGDAGSHLVGYILAIMAVLPHFYTAREHRHWVVLIPLLILAVPLGDMVWVVILRWRLGKPFYIGDTNHLSHRLVRKGLSKTQAVLLIWGFAAVCGGLAIAILKPSAPPSTDGIH